MALALRRNRYPVIFVLLIVLVIWYVTTGEQATKTSEFYTKTVAALEKRRNGGALVGAQHVKGGFPDSDLAAEDAREQRADGDLVTREILDEFDDDDDDDAYVAPGVEEAKTKEEIEYQKALVRAKQRQKDRILGELRDLMKLKERQRQAWAAHDLVMNPFWRGAMEKERKQPAVKVGVDEVKPNSDPFRDRHPDGEIVLQGEGEEKPDLDPFRDKAALAREVGGGYEEGEEWDAPGDAADVADLSSSAPLDGGEPAPDADAAAAAAEPPPPQDPADAELARILAQAPLVVFSKSYCPHSKKAKKILGALAIHPSPVIVELDEHALGPALQALLRTKTGRGTVPNVLVNGHGVGGGDDIERLSVAGTLAATLLELGAGRLSVG